MLNKKQLEDAIMCDGECEWKDKCNCGLYDLGESNIDCIQLLAKTALAYRNILEKLEWIAEEMGGHCCLICGGTKAIGHTYGCELAAILGESEVGDDG